MTRASQLNGGTTMSYFLIGEMPVDGGPLFVLWTRSPSGVQVLPIGSRDRRDMQAVGRRLMDVVVPDDDPDAMLELIVEATQRCADGQPRRLVDLDDPERDAIARSIASDLDRADSDESAAAPRYVPA